MKSIQRSNPLHLDILFGLPEGRRELAPGINTIGRSPACDIMLPHPSVAEEHCRLDCREHDGWIEDNGSAAGTFLNGQPIKSRTKIKPGDILHLGAVCLRFSAPQTRAQAPLFIQGRPVTDIPVRGSAVLGREAGCAIILASPQISPRHVRIEGGPGGGAQIIATNDCGECRINGHHFDRHQLVFGDQLDLGPFHFQYDGRVLHLLPEDSGTSLAAEDLTITVRGHRMIERVSLRIEADDFVGIIGPTGAGKSTLLRALNGLRLADTGRVLLNGNDLRSNLERYRREFGWVPQEDIVHRELTVAQALTFAARLRLPRETPDREMGRLVVQTAARLGLEQNLQSLVGRLSGGEIKKVSVAAELLCRPHILFLDEPTSGLDPGAEARLMELLRQLADGGCTVVCTTHLMRSLHLLDRLIVLAEGRLVFSGKPEEAREFFGVEEMAEIFARLEERKASEWSEAYLAMHPTQPAAEAPSPEPVISRRRRSRLQIPLVLERQWATWLSDWRNFAILLGQPILIGLLLVWAVRGTMDDTALKLFFVSVATLWFGCSNGAQEIVGEIAIYRRERMAGLHRVSYLFAKWLFMSLLTLVQGGLLWGLVRGLGAGLDGSIPWQTGGLAAISLLAAGMGLAISAVSRSSTQAVLLVPLVVIPQIVLSGYTVPASVMKPHVLAVSEAIPSFQLQRIMDVSLLWEKTIDATTLQNHLQAFQNINLIHPLKIGDVFANPEPGWSALIVQGSWMLAAAIFTLVFLARKEREY